MIRPRLHTLHTRLLLIVLAAVVPGLLLTAWMGRETRESARLDALNDASRLTLFVAGNGKALFESGRQLLVAMSALPALQNRDAAACRDYFSRLLRNYPNYTNFLAVNPDGTILCSVLKSDPGLSLSDRDWFKRVLARKEFTISGPLPGRIAKKRIVVLAHPVLDRHGEVTAVVVISLDLGWVNRLVTGIPLPAGTTVAAVDRNGRFLTRQPPDVGATETSIPDAHRIMPALLDHGVDTAQSVGIDGVERLYAFSPLVSEPGGEIFVRVGIPTDVAYAEADRALARNLALLGSVALAALLFARLFASAFILKPASRMLSAVRRLGAGDLAARVGMADAHGELAELGQAFDSMAQALDERERRLAEAEAKYRGIFEHSMEGIFQTTPEGRFMTVNPAMARMLRYDSPEELIAQVTDIGRQLYVDPSRRMEIVGLLSACDQVSDFEFEAFRKDGTKHWVSINVSAIRDPDGRVRFIEGFATDVTERKRMEEALRESEEKHRNLVERAADGIQIIQGDRIVFANPALCALVGRGKEELEGRPFTDIVHPDEIPRIRERVARRLAGEIFSKTAETVLKTKDGRDVHVESNAGLIQYNGRPADLVIVRDVTERKRAEALRQDVERMIRHDLKTPLNGILNLPQLVMAQHNLNAEQLQLLQMIQEAGERMLRIVNQSLDLFKMEAGMYVLTPVPVDLLALLRTIAAEGRRALEARGLSICVLARGEPAEGRVFTIQSDESLCYSLLANLVQNAIEASPDNGEVLVRLEENQAWTIEVHNLGAVPEDIRPRFFDKYVTAGKTRGTGLGTYLARLIAEVHGGQIGMRTSEEAGTTVTVTLPRLPGSICSP